MNPNHSTLDRLEQDIPDGDDEAIPGTTILPTPTEPPTLTLTLAPTPTPTLTLTLTLPLVW